MPTSLDGSTETSRSFSVRWKTIHVRSHWWNPSLNFTLGIPFASAGRFEHAQLYTEQLGDFDGSSYGPICPQQSAGSILSLNSSESLILGRTGTAIGPIVGALADTTLNTIGRTRSEDCLFINVQVPVGATKGDKLPVVIWIHGGAFEVGSPFTALSEADVVRGTAPNYNIGGLVRTSVDLNQPIIGVSANYRLNAFGFSASREMEEAGLLNLGLEDQRVAMQWVQAHISDFGGDVFALPSAQIVKEYKLTRDRSRTRLSSWASQLVAGL